MDFQDFKGKYQKASVEHYSNNITESPLVSVCVQTYQHANYIKKCLEGILMQETNFAFEILLGEDASTDGTREICLEYAEKYPSKVRLLLHKRENNIEMNGKPSGRFNFLYNLYSARGKYIAFCEGDDYWTDPQKLQKQFDFMESHTEFSLLAHNAFEVNKRGNERFIFPNVKSQSIINPVRIIGKGGGYCATNSIFFHSQVFEDIPRWFIDAYAGDYALYLLAIWHGEIGVLPDVMSCYRKGHANSWTEQHKDAKNMHNYLASLKAMLLDFNEYSEQKYERNIYIRIALEEIYTAVKIIKSGKLYYLKNLSVTDRRYLWPAFKKIMRRKFGM